MMRNITPSAKYDKDSMLGFTSVDERVASQVLTVVLASSSKNCSEYPAFMEILDAGGRTFWELHYPTGAP